jgi:hypothetical protein
MGTKKCKNFTLIPNLLKTFFFKAPKKVISKNVT